MKKYILLQSPLRSEKQEPKASEANAPSYIDISSKNIMPRLMENPDIESNRIYVSILMGEDTFPQRRWDWKCTFIQRQLCELDYEESVLSNFLWQKWHPVWSFFFLMVPLSDTGGRKYFPWYPAEVEGLTTVSMGFVTVGCLFCVQLEAVVVRLLSNSLIRLIFVGNNLLTLNRTWAVWKVTLP